MEYSTSSTHLPEIRKDAVFGRFVIFSSARYRRPSDFNSHSLITSSNPKHNPTSCPFCLGREHECAPEIFRIPQDADDWKIRVIENLYPALRRDLQPLPSAGSALAGFGFHDVVIETPFHGVRLPDLSQAEVGEVVVAYRERVRQLAKNESVEYVQIQLEEVEAVEGAKRGSGAKFLPSFIVFLGHAVFKNYGASAGASMAHSHSQIIGLPLVPPTVSSRLDNMKQLFDNSGKCGLCEVKNGKLLINESNHFFSIVPFAASFPFEVWIIPREHSLYFHDLDEPKALDFGGLLKLMLLKLSKQLNDPPYNFMIHSTPFRLPASFKPCTHWFMQIVPQLNVAGGFEIGSGCYINSVFPEDAAKALRELNCAIN